MEKNGNDKMGQQRRNEEVLRRDKNYKLTG